MKRRIATALLTAAPILTPSIALAQTTFHPAYQTKQITLNGHTLSKPDGFVYSGTTYMPIFYLEALLNQLDIKNSWNGNTFSWTLPPGMKLDTTKFSFGKSAYKIVVNGITVSAPPALVEKDPASGVATTYMPIWYLFSALKAIGLTYQWTEGTNFVVQSNIPLFTTWSKSGSKLGSGYYTVMDALSSLNKQPGGLVKDLNGTVIATEPDYAAFSSPLDNQPTDYTTSTDAAKAVAGDPSGYVVDMSNHTVVASAAVHYEMSGGLFIEINSNGAAPLGTQVPPFAKPDTLYVAMDKSATAPPYLTEFYQIATLTGSRWVYQSPSYVGSFEDSFRNVDLNNNAPSNVTAAQMNNWLAGKNSFLSGLGSSFINAQSTYGVNAVYLLSHAYLESGPKGSTFATTRNNLYGYGALTGNANLAATFPSADYAIQFQAWAVKNNYLQSSGNEYYQSPTLDGMSKHYATDLNWSAAVASVMDQYVHETDGSMTDYPQYNGSPVSNPGANNLEPVYHIEGANGKVEVTPYDGLPVFFDLQTASAEMYSGPLQNGSAGNAVIALQQALVSRGFGVGTSGSDGIYGGNTANAVASFQQSVGISATGVCDFATWKALFPPSVTVNAGTPIQVNKIAEAAYGDEPAEWFYIEANNGVSGWVLGSDVQLQNVEHIQPSSGFTVPVVNASHVGTGTLRLGDTVAVLSTDGSGYVEVAFNDSASNSTNTGYVLASSLAP